MAKKILVAGAGLGGLAVAGKLAKKGYNVTVFAEKTPENHGYDWEDAVDISTVARVLELDESTIEHGHLGCMSFHNPRQTISLDTKKGGVGATKMERRLLSELVIGFAKQAGVQFNWNTRVTGAITEGNRVVGIRTETEEIFGDLVIDACGVFSVVRQSLPAGCKIERHTKYGDVFCAYRGIFEKNGDALPGFPYEIFLVHEDEQGISWLITEENSVDILIGRFEVFGQDKVEKTLASMREKYPQLGQKLLRGGSIAPIPVRRPAAKFVCDGYAAIGDSAYMTYPMAGSGIDITLDESDRLVAVIEADTEGVFSTETLWKYNYDYIHKRARSLVGTDRLKNMLLNLKPRDLDFLFEKQIITADDVASNGSSGNSKTELVGKAVRGIPKLDKLLQLVLTIKNNSEATAIYRSIPEFYADEAFDIWKKNVDSTVISLQKPV